MDKPDLLVLGLDRQAIEIGLAVAALGGQVVVADRGESAVEQAIRDGEMLARLADCADRAEFEARRLEILADIQRQRSRERLLAARLRLLPGPARFLDRRRIALGEAVFMPRRMVLATGCHGFAPEAAWRALFARGIVPPRIVLRGTGAATLTLASLFARLGTQVRLASEAPLAPTIDPDGLRLLLDDFERHGGICLAAGAEPPDAPFWPIGEPTPALAGLDAEKAGLRLDRGRLALRNGFETGNPRIVALGRVADPAALPDPGAVGHLIGRLFFRRPARYRPMPALRLAGGERQIAEIGLAEPAALARPGAQIARAAFADADPADRSGGFVKLFADGKGVLLGACLYGPRAGERIAPLSLALAQGLTLADIARLPLPPGGAADAIRLAAGSAGRALLRAPKVQRAFRFFRAFG